MKRTSLTIIGVMVMTVLAFAVGVAFRRGQQTTFRPFVMYATLTQYDSKGNGLWLRNERTAVDREGNVTIMYSFAAGAVSYLYTLAEGGQYLSNGKVTGELVGGKHATLRSLPQDAGTLKAAAGFVGMDLVLGLPTFASEMKDPQGASTQWVSPLTNGLPLKNVVRHGEVTSVVEPSSIEFRDPTPAEMWHP